MKTFTFKEKKIPRIKDIAKELNLSIATVSRALSYDNGLQQKVSANAREQISKVASKMGYQRNRGAEFMKKRRSAVIGVFIPDYADALTANLMFGMSQIAVREGFSINFFPGANEHDFQKFLHGNIATQSIGIISYPLRTLHVENLASELIEYHHQGGEVILLNTDQSPEDIPILAIDEFVGGRMAAEILVRLDVDAFVIWGSDHYPLERRLAGFCDFCRECGDIRPIIRWERWETPELFLEQIYHRYGQFGIFATSDEMALRMFRELEKIKLEPGRDIPIIGFDDLKLSSLARPSLSTIQQPFRELGRLAVKCLISGVYGEKTSSQMLLPYPKERESTLLFRKSCD